MPLVNLNLTDGYYKSKDATLANTRNINLFKVYNQGAGGRYPSSLRSVHGLSEWVDTGFGTARGFIKFKEELYTIQGTNLVKIASDKTVTNLGTIPGTSKCMLAQNGESIAIVIPDGNSYFYDVDAGLNQITDGTFTGFGQVNGVVEKDFYFIFTTEDLFFNSSLATVSKGQSFNATDFGTAEVSTDKIVRPFTVHDELFIMGEETIELFQNIGGADFPFQRINGAHVDKGLTSRFSVIEFDNSYVYLGKGFNEGPAIWRGTQGSAVKISTDAIETKLATYTDSQLSAINSWTYMSEGYFFLGFNLPDTTIVFDGTASAIKGIPQWHERQSNGTRWVGEHIICIYGKILVQDINTGKILAIEPSVYTEKGSNVKYTLDTEYINTQGQPVKNYLFELQAQQGESTDYFSQPTIDLQISEDFGRSFISVGVKNIGRGGEYKNRTQWRQLGRIERNRQYRLEATTDRFLSFQNIGLGITR